MTRRLLQRGLALVGVFASLTAACGGFVTPREDAGHTLDAPIEEPPSDARTGPREEAAVDGAGGALPACARAPVRITDNVGVDYARLFYAHGAFRVAWLEGSREPHEGLLRFATLDADGHVAAEGLVEHSGHDRFWYRLNLAELPDGFVLVAQLDSQTSGVVPTTLFRFSSAGALVGRAVFDANLAFGARYVAPNLELLTSEEPQFDPEPRVILERRALEDGALRSTVSSERAYSLREELFYATAVTWLPGERAGFVFDTWGDEHGRWPSPIGYFEAGGRLVRANLPSFATGPELLRGSAPVLPADGTSLAFLTTRQHSADRDAGFELWFERYPFGRAPEAPRVVFSEETAQLRSGTLMAARPGGYTAAWVATTGAPDSESMFVATLGADGVLEGSPRELATGAPSYRLHSAQIAGDSTRVGISWMQAPAPSAPRWSLYFACPAVP